MQPTHNRAGRHGPQGLRRAAEVVSWLHIRSYGGIAKAPVASSMATYRKIPWQRRTAGVGRSATVESVRWGHPLI